MDTGIEACVHDMGGKGARDEVEMRVTAGFRGFGDYFWWRWRFLLLLFDYFFLFLCREMIDLDQTLACLR